jgi:PIN domain-containing protein
VDYENVGRVDLNSIPAGVRVPFFFGASQKSVPTEFLKAALKLGDRFIPIDIEGQGKNALDFHIAFYLGDFLSKSPKSRCIVLSKDKGFDPLIKHLVRRGYSVRRVATLAEAFGTSARLISTEAVAPADRMAEALQWLKSTQKNRRPRKRTGLVAHLFNHFGKKIPEESVQAFIDRLIADKQISDVKGAITYHF